MPKRGMMLKDVLEINRLLSVIDLVDRKRGWELIAGVVPTTINIYEPDPTFIAMLMPKYLFRAYVGEDYFVHAKSRHGRKVLHPDAQKL